MWFLSDVVYKFQDLDPQSQSTEDATQEDVTQEVTQEVDCGARVVGEWQNGELLGECSVLSSAVVQYFNVSLL